MALLGGTGDVRAPSAEEIEMLNNLKPDIETRLGKSAECFEPVQISTQVVAGTNYFAKVHIGGNSHVHVRVFKPLPHVNAPVQLHGVLADKTAEDSLAYFDANCQ